MKRIELKKLIKEVILESIGDIKTPQDAAKVFEMFGIENVIQMDKETLKKCWISLTKKYHPDTGGNPQSLKYINAAYDVLKDRAPSSSNQQRSSTGSSSKSSSTSGDTNKKSSQSSSKTTEEWQYIALIKMYKDKYGIGKEELDKHILVIQKEYRTTLENAIKILFDITFKIDSGPKEDPYSGKWSGGKKQEPHSEPEERPHTNQTYAGQSPPQFSPIEDFREWLKHSNFIILENNAKYGPYSYDDVVDLYKKSRIDKQTFISVGNNNSWSDWFKFGVLILSSSNREEAIKILDMFRRCKPNNVTDQQMINSFIKQFPKSWRMIHPS